jgi:LysM repeat protein
MHKQSSIALVASGLAALIATGAQAQQYPVTPEQRSTAQQVAQAGVPLSELAPNAPDQYTVKRGDTLWAISGIFLKTAWRWPELWGMNMQEVHNPHLIYPGQQLVLEKVDGRARLRFGAGGQLADAGPSETLRVSPRVRVEPLADAGAIPTLQTNLIEPFLSEPMIVGEGELLAAPRIVAVPENHVLISTGDRAYARGLSTNPLKLQAPGRDDPYRVFRDARPIVRPGTNTVIAYEAAYLGKALLVRSEGQEDAKAPVSSWLPSWNIGSSATVIPATLDVVYAKEEMRVGDRLLPEPPRQFRSYTPHAPAAPVMGTIVSVYGDAVSVAGQNQVVLIDKGTADGVDTGTVLGILKAGARMQDRTQSGQHAAMKLPDERNGLMMVFRTFDNLSYALILQISDGVQIGDRVTNPR